MLIDSRDDVRPLIIATFYSFTFRYWAVENGNSPYLTSAAFHQAVMDRNDDLVLIPVYSHFLRNLGVPHYVADVVAPKIVASLR